MSNINTFIEYFQLGTLVGVAIVALIVSVFFLWNAILTVEWIYNKKINYSWVTVVFELLAGLISLVILLAALGWLLRNSF
jgi:hypothetical protein